MTPHQIYRLRMFYESVAFLLDDLKGVLNAGQRDLLRATLGHVATILNEEAPLWGTKRPVMPEEFKL